MTRQMKLLCVPAMAFFLFLVGCGGDKPPQTAKVAVKGQVNQKDGKPFTGGLVLTFHPVSDSKVGQNANLTVQPTTGAIEGECFPGEYRVSAMLPPTDTGGGSVAAPGSVPQMKQVEVSPGIVKVPEGGLNDLVLTISKLPKSKP